ARLHRFGSGHATVVEVVRPERRPREPGERVRVLVREPPTGEERDALALGPLHDAGEDLLELSRLQTVLSQQRRRHAVLAVGKRVRVTTLDAKPRLVHVNVI